MLQAVLVIMLLWNVKGVGVPPMTKTAFLKANKFKKDWKFLNQVQNPPEFSEWLPLLPEAPVAPEFWPLTIGKEEFRNQNQKLMIN